MKLIKAHQWDRDKHDHYVEEQRCSDYLFASMEFEGDFILDPCCGWGRIINVAHAYGYKTKASDIVDRRLAGTYPRKTPFRQIDFLAPHDDRTYQWWMGGSIVGNPPFNQIKDFCVRAVALVSTGRKVAFIFPVRRLNAASWLKDLGLRKILYMTPRPSMPTGNYILDGGKVGGGKQDFCWVIFEKGYTGAHEVDWLRLKPEARLPGV